MVHRSPETMELMEIIEENQLFATVTDIDPFVREVILEFYANLHIFPQETKKASMYVRGKMYEFSPMMINQVFKSSPVKWHKKSELDRV